MQGDVFLLFEFGGQKRLATTLTDSSAKNTSFIAWYMDTGKDGKLHCLDRNKKQSDVHVLERECIVTKIAGVSVDINTGTVHGEVADWSSAEKSWNAFYKWVKTYMPDALKAAK